MGLKRNGGKESVLIFSCICITISGTIDKKMNYHSKGYEEEIGRITMVKAMRRKLVDKGGEWREIFFQRRLFGTF